MRRFLLALVLLTLAAPAAAQVNVGRESVGSSSRNLSSLAKGLRITMPAGGYAPGVTISCHVGDTDAGGEEFVAFIVQSADASTILAQSAARTDISSTTWYTFSGSSLATFQPVGGTAYIIGCASTATSGAIFTQDDAGLEGFASNDVVADVTPLTWGSTPGLASDAVRDYSVYLTATPAPVFGSISSTTYATRTGSTAITAPSGIVDGDVLLLAYVVGASSAPTIGVPSGFTTLQGPTTASSGGFGVTRVLAYKIASGESGDYSVTHTGGSISTQGVILRIAGGSSTIQSSTNSGTGTTTTSLGVTTTRANALVVFIAHNWQLYGTASPPTGTSPTFTERLDAGTSLLYIATGELAAAGATGDKSHANGNAGGDPWGAFMVAVEAPDEGGGSTGVAMPINLTLGVGP